LDVPSTPSCDKMLKTVQYGVASYTKLPDTISKNSSEYDQLKASNEVRSQVLPRAVYPLLAEVFVLLAWAIIESFRMTRRKESEAELQPAKT